MKFRKLLVLFLCIILTLTCVAKVEAKRKWIVVKKIGSVNISHYTPQSNTPAGSRQTYSGRKAKANHTVAVDAYNPVAGMFQKVRIKYKNKSKHRKQTVIYTVEDKGGFGRYGRQFDVFTEASGQGVVEGYAEIVRLETKKEYKQRLKRAKLLEEKRKAKERKKKQQGTFELIYDHSLSPNQIVTDPDYIQGGCLSFTDKESTLFDVVGTESGLGNRIKVGDKLVAQFGLKLKLVTVYEKAVG